MAYPKTVWKDRSVQYPRTYSMTDNGDDTYTLTPVTGTVYEAGTPVNASNLNKIEDELETLDARTYALNGDDITGVLPLSKGGTGATTAAAALTAIGAAASNHNHAIADLTGTLAVNKGGTGATTAANARTNLGITPANIGAAAASHNHAIADLTGTLAVNKGGTGATTAAGARTNLGITLANLGAAAASHSHNLTDLSGTLTIAKGGTGATTAAGARTNLGITPANIGAATSGHSHALDSSSLTSTLPVTKGGTGWSVLEAGKVLIGRGTNASVELKAYAGWAWDGSLLGSAPSGQTTVFTLAKAGTWLIITGHNSTPALNTAWIARTSGNNIFMLSAAGSGVTITMSLSGTSLSVTPPSGVSLGVYGIFLG